MIPLIAFHLDPSMSVWAHLMPYPHYHDKPANQNRLSDLSSPQCISGSFGKAHGSRPDHHLSKPLTLYTAWATKIENMPVL